MFRWRTLLQFGDSWQVVGSVVMKNPGSAYPLTPNQCVSDMFILPELQTIDDSEPWYEFKPDITMSCITRLFGVQSGVIQIFNLFNIREADLAQALHLYDEASPCVFTQQTNPDPSSLITHTSSLISPPSSLIPHLSSLIPLAIHHRARHQPVEGTSLSWLGTIGQRWAVSPEGSDDIRCSERQDELSQS